MSDIAIKTAGLSKRYRIGGEAHLLKDMRDTVSDIVSSPTHFLRERVRRLRSNDDLTLWALRDLDLEVKRGEIVGVIGRNGAGKSTLLKILSRITEPTYGYADIFGRVGSLLEVGTGFHYDLTGRENVYLNGAMLGMKRWEIASRLDEIVAFSGVERFLDTPVKHYSSGMFLRLAFSVAAHLDTEILLVDEILAVGDLEFQKKCLSKMDDVATQGRTVLFVSHNLAVMKQLCETCLVLDNGSAGFRGPVVEGIARYSKLLTEGAATDEVAGHGWWGVKVGSRVGGLGASVATDEPLAAEAWLELEQDVSKCWVYCIVEDSVGETIVHSRIGEQELGGPLFAGRYRVRVNAPALHFAPGLYSLHLKFIGHNGTGADVKHMSERVLLDVAGNVQGIASARLAPPIGWSVEPAVFVSEREACAD